MREPCRHSYGTEVVGSDLAFKVDGKIVAKVSREEFLAAIRPTAIADMRNAVAQMERECAAIRARIEESAGRKRHARFYRIAAGVEEGSLEAARLEARAETYLQYREFYSWETPAEREAVLDLVKAMEESTLSPTALAIGAACKPRLAEPIAEALAPWAGGER